MSTLFAVLNPRTFESMFSNFGCPSSLKSRVVRVINHSNTSKAFNGYKIEIQVKKDEISKNMIRKLNKKDLRSFSSVVMPISASNYWA